MPGLGGWERVSRRGDEFVDGPEVRSGPEVWLWGLRGVAWWMWYSIEAGCVYSVFR